MKGLTRAIAGWATAGCVVGALIASSLDDTPLLLAIVGVGTITMIMFALLHEGDL